MISILHSVTKTLDRVEIELGFEGRPGSAEEWHCHRHGAGGGEKILLWGQEGGVAEPSTFA